jgi:hypothetical protein
MIPFPRLKHARTAPLRNERAFETAEPHGGIDVARALSAVSVYGGGANASGIFVWETTVFEVCAASTWP